MRGTSKPWLAGANVVVGAVALVAAACSSGAALPSVPQAGDAGGGGGTDTDASVGPIGVPVLSDGGAQSGLDGGGELADAGKSKGAGDAAAADSGFDAGPNVSGEAFNFGAYVNPGSCLDVVAAGTAAGTQLDEYSCNTTGAQSFVVADAGSGAVRLYNASSGKCVDIADGGTANGTHVQLAACADAPEQTYTLADAGAGLVNIVNTNSKKCVDVPYANPANGTVLQLFDCNQSVAQLWNPSPVASGYTGSCGVATLQAGVVLAANCATEASGLQSTTLDLNSCVTNSNGTLGWEQNGGFGGSCTGCSLAGSTLTCQCNDVSAQAVTTTLDLSANVNNCNGVLTCGQCGSGTVSSGATAFTALYGSDGNDFYTFTGSSSVANLKTSGWNALFVFAGSVQSNGDITFGGTTVVHAGAYVGNASWGSNVDALKMQPTSVTRYEVTVGGWGDGSYDNIESLVASNGTGPGSTLYQNFQALKNAVPGIDAINDDDEQTYDIGSATAFGQMINALGMKLTQVPYMNQSFWVQLKNNLGSGTDIVYLQCYQGGAGNDPGQWDSAYGNGFHVVPGQESNNHGTSWWSGWSSADQVTGGFYWPDVTWAPNANWGVFEIAGGLGLPPQ